MKFKRKSFSYNVDGTPVINVNIFYMIFMYAYCILKIYFLDQFKVIYFKHQ